MSLRNLIVEEVPFYMVASSCYGFHLYSSLRDSLRAIVDSVYVDDYGKIYVMEIGPTYQDSTTKEVFTYIRKGDVTLETIDNLCMDIDSNFEDNEELMETLINLINNQKQ